VRLLFDRHTTATAIWRGYVFLNSLYIDGYGPFRDALIGDFRPGFNLVVTKDEQSARALRAFIWSVLFGFGSTGSTATKNGTYGGFLGFESDEGPVTVSRYSRMGSVDLSGEGGLVTVTGADRNLEQLVGTANPQQLRSIYSIDPADFERFRNVVKFQIAQTLAEIARVAAEEESAARQAAGFADRPPSIYEIMEEMRAGRSLQIARVDNLQRSVIGVGRRLRSARKRQARLELLTELRPAWNSMLELQRQMSELPRLPYMGDDPLISLEMASSSLSMARSKAEAARVTEEQRVEAIEAIQPSDDELAELAEIESLLDGRQEFEQLVANAEETEAKLKTSRAGLESHLSQIEGGWTVERAQKFAAEVVPADIELHSIAMSESESAHANAQKELQGVSTELGKAEAEVASAEMRLSQLSDVAEDVPEELESRLDILNRLKANLLAITTKRAEVASIEVKRTEAGRIGSGLSHMLVMAQMGVSGLFALTGIIIWAAALIAHDSMTARTGLVMLGAGLVGTAFGATYLQLQRRPRMKVLLEPDVKAAQRPTTIKGHLLRAVQVSGATIVSTVQTYQAKRAAKATEQGLTGAEPGATPIAAAKRSPFGIKEIISRFSNPKSNAASSESESGLAVEATAASASTKLRIIVMSLVGKLAKMNSEPAEPTTSSNEAIVGDDVDEMEAEPTEASDLETSKSPFGIMKLISKITSMRGGSPSVEDSEDTRDESEDSDDEEADESSTEVDELETKQSPFSIMNLIGKFISSRKSEDVSSESEDDADEEDPDDLLAAISAEITEEETSSEDDEEVADSIARAQSDVPDDLKEAQERAEEESKPGLLNGLLARIMSARQSQQPDDDDIVGEMSDDAVEASSSFSGLLGALISRIRKPGEQAVVAADTNPEAGVEVEESASAAKSDETTAEGSEVAEVGDANADDKVVESEDANAGSNETDDAAPVASEADAPKAAESVAEDESQSNSFEIDDPQKALDHSVARASLQVEQLEAEVDRLLGIYAASVDQKKEHFGTVTPETIGYEIARTERRAARRSELEERRTEVEALKQAVIAAQSEVNAKRDRTAETSGAVTHAQEGWQEWLFGVDLDTEMSVTQVRRVLDTLDPIRSQVTACEDLEQQVAKLRGDADRIEARIRNLADSSLDESVSIDLCFRSLERVAIGANSRISRVADMTTELRTLEKERAEADAEWSEVDFKMQSVLDEAGAADEMEFRSLVEGSAKRKELSSQLERLRYETPLITGIDAAELKADLKSINHERAHAELAELPERIDRLHAQLSLLEQDMADGETELAHLPEIPEDVERNLESGRHTPPPMTSILGRPLSDQIIAASVRFLKMLTGDAYDGIEMITASDGRNTIGYSVVDREGNVSDPREVDSSALFMALRAGAAQIYGAAAGSVPMVLNDFFGSLEPADSRIAMGGLAALAANQQVICVTSDARAGARFAVLGNPDQIHLVDATDLESPFKEVAAG